MMASPLLHGEGLRGVEAETFGLHLRVESVKVEVYHHAVARGRRARSRAGPTRARCRVLERAIEDLETTTSVTAVRGSTRGVERATGRARAGDEASDETSDLARLSRRGFSGSARVLRAGAERHRPHQTGEHHADERPRADGRLVLATVLGIRRAFGLFARGIDVSKTASAHETAPKSAEARRAASQDANSRVAGRRFERDVRTLATARRELPHRVPIPNPNGGVPFSTVRKRFSDGTRRVFAARVRQISYGTQSVTNERVA